MHSTKFSLAFSEFPRYLPGAIPHFCVLVTVPLWTQAFTSSPFQTTNALLKSNCLLLTLAIESAVVQNVETGDTTDVKLLVPKRLRP